MLKEITIGVLLLTTFIFATLFVIYYNNVDKYMKDKEVNIINRENEVAKKEELCKKYETCSNEIINLKSKINKARELLVSL